MWPFSNNNNPCKHHNTDLTAKQRQKEPPGLLDEGFRNGVLSVGGGKFGGGGRGGKRGGKRR